MGEEHSPSVQLAAILIPHLHSDQPEPVIRALRDTAGDDTETLARVCGQMVGYAAGQQAGVMRAAVLQEIYGAAQWAEFAHRVLAEEKRLEMARAADW